MICTRVGLIPVLHLSTTTPVSVSQARLKVLWSTGQAQLQELGRHAHTLLLTVRLTSLLVGDFIHFSAELLKKKGKIQ